MAFKYIVINVHGRSLPIIFPDLMVHDDTFRAVREAIWTGAMEAGANPPEVSVVSAGSIDGLSVVAASGYSETLKLGANESDARLINGFAYNHGIKGTY